ncbi:hypothetical protein OH77DRAFT_137307 [Trametes cingulata]|nr:hypothetical protein OH77DRAFT_137307 [Trametes cingulata]
MSTFGRQRSSRLRSHEYPYPSPASRNLDSGRGEVPRKRESNSRSHGRKGGLVTAIQMNRLVPQSPATTLATTYAESASADSWTLCAAAMKDHDEARIQAWKEEIDSELLFAALFSAIMTAFDVEVYKELQPQSSDSSGPNVPTPSAIVINALWFSALICSLAAASIGILVRQWLNQYTGGLASVSPDIARVRQFRRDGLKKWKVAEIMMLLPILLQGAVVLFLIGLILFLNQFNKEVTRIAIVLVAILLFFILVTTVLPTFKDDCPYQSPQAWGFFVIFQAVKKPLRSLCRSICAYMNRLSATNVEGSFYRLRSRYAKRIVQQLTPFANKPNTYSWVARERMLVEASGGVLDQHLLVEADATFLEDQFLDDVVRPCLTDMPPDAAIKSYYDIMSHRADRIQNGLPYFDTRNDRPESVAILTHLTLDALQKARADPPSREHAIRIMRILEHLVVVTLPLAYDHFCRVFFALSNDSDERVRHYAFSILYQHLWRNLALADQHASHGCHDLSALVKFIAWARQDDNNGPKAFLDACDLVICLATLPSLTLSDHPEMLTDLQGTLLHLNAFFETPLWHKDPALLYPIARIALHLVALEERYSYTLHDDFFEVLAGVVEQARQLNHDGNWEDKLKILERSFRELRKLRHAKHSRPAEEEDRVPGSSRGQPASV